MVSKPAMWHNNRLLRAHCKYNVGKIVYTRWNKACCVLKIVNTPKGPIMSVVPFEEYMDLAEGLKYAAQNTKAFTDKPSKS